MDRYNNRIGRLIAKYARNEEEAAVMTKRAIDNGLLVTNPSKIKDKRANSNFMRNLDSDGGFLSLYKKGYNKTKQDIAITKVWLNSLVDKAF